MAWRATSSSLLSLAAVGVAALVVVGGWRHRDERGAWPLLVLMVALGSRSLAYAVQLGYMTKAGQLLWQQIGLALGAAIPTIGLLFAVQYAGYDDQVTRPRLAVLAVEPTLFALLAFTNPVHGLVWSGSELVATGAGPVVALSFEAVYYLHRGYSYLVVAAGIAVLGSVLGRSSSVYRRQAGALILGVLPPFIANVAVTLGVSWGPLPVLDPTPLAYVVTGVMWALALFQFDLLERTPIARKRVFDETGDGLIVADTDGRVVDVNSVAREALTPTPAVGSSITALVDEADSPEAALHRLDRRTVTATVEGRERAYDVGWSSLTDHYDETAGHVLTIRDVTERNVYQQRLEVTQRLLRHNLRNDMTVIRGCAALLAEEVDTEQAPTAQRIVDAADDLLDLSEKTRTMASLDSSATSGRTTVDVPERLATLVADARDEHPEVRIECEPPEAAEIALSDPKLFEIPVRNLIENAVEHNDAAKPLVRVRAERADGQIRVHVEDNGPTIPTVEREVLEAGTENQLEHGSGMGLWLTYWSVANIGGTITFDTAEPRGNVITLELPAVSPAAEAPA